MSDVEDRASYKTLTYLSRRDFADGLPSTAYRAMMKLYADRGGTWSGYFSGDPDMVGLLKECVKNVSKAWKSRRPPARP